MLLQHLWNLPHEHVPAQQSKGFSAASCRADADTVRVCTTNILLLYAKFVLVSGNSLTITQTSANCK